MLRWVGLVLFAVGAWLLAASFLRHRRGRVVAVRPELAAYGAMMRGVILFALALVGLKIGMMFLVFGGDGLFSGMNLAGVEFLLASYGTWIFVSLAPPKSAAVIAERGVMAHVPEATE